MGQPIKGNCPMGCGETLQVHPDGTITCRDVACLEPGAVGLLLADVQAEHVVEFTEIGFLTRHPLWERIHTGLVDCRFHEELGEAMHQLAGPPVEPGTYLADRTPGGEWQFTSINKEAMNG